MCASHWLFLENMEPKIQKVVSDSIETTNCFEKSVTSFFLFVLLFIKKRA